LKKLQDEASPEPIERYYRDSHGSIISETEAELKILQIRNELDAMPDNLEKAYLEGVLQAVEEEWDRIKRQGSVSYP